MKKTTCFLSFCLLFGACSPLHHQIYLLNHSKSPLSLTLTNSTNGFNLSHEFYVHALRQTQPINNKTRQQLTDSLPVRQEDRQTLVFTVPPQTTVYLTDLFPLTEHRGNNRLVIDKAGISETLNLNYPYRHIPLLKRTGARFSLFYRLICHIDIGD